MIVLSEDGYSIKGIAPPDLRDHPEFALAFWQWVTDLGLKAKDNELSRGLDKNGKLLKRISEATRLHRRSAMTPTGKGDPSAPPLTPGRQLSRTRSLLTGRAYPDHAAFWWRFDPWTGDSWARVLEHQRDDWGRDVFGLSPKAEAAVKARAWAMWADLKAGRPIPVITARQTTPVAIPQAGRTPTAAAVFGIGAGGRTPGPGFSGGLTRKEWEAYFRAPAKVQIPSRPGDDYNVILRHIWGAPGGPAKAVAIVPKPPKPKPVVQRVAMAPAPPKPPQPPPKPPTFEEVLEDRLKALPPGTDTATRKARRLAIAEVVEAHAQAGPTGAFHGMDTPETFRTVHYNGLNLHFTGKPDLFGAITNTLENLQRRKVALPRRLVKMTKNVYFTGQRNNKDAMWAQRYNTPDFKSNATGGDGDIVVYNGQPMGVSTLAHESGHNLATDLYGSTTPGGHYGYMLRSVPEPPVSDYAKNSPSEDFAEACMFYVEEYDTMKARFPERFRIIHKLMTESSYGG